MEKGRVIITVVKVGVCVRTEKSEHSLMRLIRAVRDAEQGETSIQPNPENDITKELILLDSGNSPDGNQRYLCQLECKQVHPGTR